MNVVKAKQWLKDNGYISEVTRGRISYENHARLAEAYKGGQRFTDWEPKETTTSTGATVVKNSKPAPNKTNENIVGEVTILWPENQYVVFERGTKTKRSMREVCMHCGVSLVQCQCDMLGREPRIVSTNMTGSVSVFIERATK